LKLGDVDVATSPTETGATFRTNLPNRLPDDRKLPLIARAGDARKEVAVATRADPPVSASLSADPDGRRARVSLKVLDQHGNLAARESFEVRATNANVGRIARKRGRFRAGLVAHDSARFAEVAVVVGDRELARTRVAFSPPHRAFVVGAFAAAGWLHNGGDISVPRGGVGAALRKGFGPIEWALLVGAEGFSFEDSQRQEIAGAERDVSRSLRALAVPVLVRGRLPLTRRLGAALGAGIVPVGADASLTVDFQETDEQRKWVLGVRALASLDARLGPGRVMLTGTLGRARLSGGPLVGNIEGWGVLAGYEWWPLDLGF
jgi:hypothetical protein